MLKRCTKCNIEKELKEFYKKERWLYWVGSACKNCHNEDASNRLKTKKWLLRQIFDLQKNTSKQRWHSLQTYTKQELEEWFWHQFNAEELYNNRIKSWYKKDLSWYKKDLKPSCDRLNDYE